MLRRLVKPFVLALFACWVTGFGYVVLSASHKAPTEQHHDRASYSKNQSQPDTAHVATAVQPQTYKDKQQPSNREKGAVEIFFEFKLTDILLVIFTGLLAFKTSGLFKETAGLRDAAEKQRIDSLRSIVASENAANAAQKSIELARQEFLSTHRPRIILREAIIGSLLEGEPINVSFHLANVGETTGHIVKSSLRVEQINRGFERLMLHGSIVDAPNPLGDIQLGAGAAIILGFDGETPKWDKERFKERTLDTTAGPRPYRNATIHFVGQFIYIDESRILRRTAFRRELNPERQRFYRIPDEPDQDYSD